MPEILEKDMTDTQKLLWNVTSLSTNLLETNQQVAKHHRLLIEGNGELPLVEQIRNLNTFVNGVRYWMKFLIGALLLQTMAFLGTALVYFIKLYPMLEKLSNTS